MRTLGEIRGYLSRALSLVRQKGARYAFRAAAAKVNAKTLRIMDAPRTIQKAERGQSEKGLALSALGTLRFQCNICGRACQSRVVDLQPEKRSCACGSTVRTRAIVHLLSTELFARSLALPDFPIRRDIHGWGMSDSVYPDLLARKLGYVNTFYHQEPRLDITAPPDPATEGSLDFLISTEVFEHIPPPVARGFQNARRLLKPTGVLIFSVPYTLEPETREHFPELYQYRVVDDGVAPTLENVTRDGRKQVFDNLVFHGGPGATLEMRVFSRAGLLAELQDAGFGNVRICSEPCWEFGIYWTDSWSLPLVARPASSRGMPVRAVI